MVKNNNSTVDNVQIHSSILFSSNHNVDRKLGSVVLLAFGVLVVVLDIYGESTHDRQSENIKFIFNCLVAPVGKI